MNTARTVSISAIACALAVALVGCNQTSAGTADTAVLRERLNTEVCYAAPWIRERAPAGLCESTHEIDDSMSLRRLHEERRLDR
jgi:hypothetical protein